MSPHLLTAEARIAADALASAYTEFTDHPTAGKLLAAVAVHARNAGRLDRLTVGPALGNRHGLTRPDTYRARGELARRGWLKPAPVIPSEPGVRPRIAWTLTAPESTT